MPNAHKQKTIFNTYAITWCPKNSYQFNNLTFTYNTHKSIVQSEWNCSAVDFIFNAELTEVGNLHYHGTVIVYDKIRFFKKLLPTLKYKGFVKLVVLRNYGDWVKYCIKDHIEMKKIVGDPQFKTFYMEEKDLNPLKVTYKNIVINTAHIPIGENKSGFVYYENGEFRIQPRNKYGDFRPEQIQKIK